MAPALAESLAVTVRLARATVFDSVPRSAVARGSFDFRSLRGILSLTPQGARQTEPVVFTPAAVYIRPPAASELLPPGKSWIVDRFADTPALAGSFPQFVAQVESINPGLVLDELAWGATTASAAGRDTVSGQGTTRYDVTVALGQAMAGATGPAREPFAVALETEIAALGGSTPAAVGVRAWVADSGRLLRIELTPPGTGLGTTTMTLTRLDGPVRADPPPAGQVVELTALTPTGERENRNGGDADGG